MLDNFYKNDNHDLNIFILELFDRNQFNLDEIIYILLGIFYNFDNNNNYYHYELFDLINRLKDKVLNNFDIIPETIFELIGLIN